MPDDFATAASAARDGDLRTLAVILDRSPGVLTASDGDGRTLLALSCRAATGDIAIPRVDGTPRQHAAVDSILAAGADPSAADHQGWTPLHTAAMAGHDDLAQRLVAAGASVSAEAHGLEGATPLSYALFYAKAYMGPVLTPTCPDNLRCAAALGADVQRFFDGEGLTADASAGLGFYAPIFFPAWERTRARQEVLDEALSWASRNDQCGTMAELLVRGADVDASAFRGTPLLWACYADKVAAATWLLDHGADPDLRHDWGGEGHGVGAVAMHLAAQHNSVKCLNLLLDRGADATVVDAAHGGTPAGWAEYSGAGEALELLRRRVG